MMERIRQPVKMKRFLKEHEGFLFGYVGGDFVSSEPVKNVEKINIESATLTSIQKAAYSKAKQMGYFDFPKRITLSNLAKEMGVSPSTLCVKLQMVLSRITKRIDL